MFELPIKKSTAGRSSFLRTGRAILSHPAVQSVVHLKKDWPESVCLKRTFTSLTLRALGHTEIGGIPKTWHGLLAHVLS
jgi:hypothetical protein